MADKDQKSSRALKAVARIVDAELHSACGVRMGFSLIVFPYDAGDRMNYIGNVDRKQAIAALEQLLAGWKAGMPDVPAHEVQ